MRSRFSGLDFGLFPQSKLNPKRLTFENLHAQACRAVVPNVDLS
jgi:hypothetical protein